MGFVDDDEAKVFDWGEEGGARADDDEGGAGGEDVLPDEVALRFGLLGVEEGDAREVLLEVVDELGGEGYFGDEEDGGLVFG